MADKIKIDPEQIKQVCTSLVSQLELNCELIKDMDGILDLCDNLLLSTRKLPDEVYNSELCNNGLDSIDLVSQASYETKMATKDCNNKLEFIVGAVNQYVLDMVKLDKEGLGYSFEQLLSDEQKTEVMYAKKNGSMDSDKYAELLEKYLEQILGEYTYINENGETIILNDIDVRNEYSESRVTIEDKVRVIRKFTNDGGYIDEFYRDGESEPFKKHMKARTNQNDSHGMRVDVEANHTFIEWDVYEDDNPADGFKSWYNACKYGVVSDLWFAVDWLLIGPLVFVPGIGDKMPGAKKSAEYEEKMLKESRYEGDFYNGIGLFNIAQLVIGAMKGGPAITGIPTDHKFLKKIWESVQKNPVLLKSVQLVDDFLCSFAQLAGFPYTRVFEEVDGFPCIPGTTKRIKVSDKTTKIPRPSSIEVPDACKTSTTHVVKDINGNDININFTPESKEHLICGDGIRIKTRGISGAHTMDNFKETLRVNSTDFFFGNDKYIISETPHPDVPGVVQIDYRIQTYDNYGRPLGQSKPNDPKTVFTNDYTTDEILEMCEQAIGNSVVDPQSPRSYIGLADNGLHFNIFLDSNGDVLSIYPILPNRVDSYGQNLRVNP